MDAKKAKVLVIDDDEMMRIILNNLLTNEGYETHLSANANRALEKIKRNHFDLVITDIVMRNMDGMELIKAAQKIDPQTKFVVLTAYPSPVTFDQSMELGAINYLAKPIDIEQTKVLLRRVIRKPKGVPNK